MSGKIVSKTDKLKDKTKNTQKERLTDKLLEGQFKKKLTRNIKKYQTNKQKNQRERSTHFLFKI